MIPTDKGPPKGESSELFARLIKLPRPNVTIDFPRRDPATKEESIGKVAIVPLTESELMGCRAAAEMYSREMLKDQNLRGESSLGYQDIYRNALIVELIAKAVRQPDDLRFPIFPTPKLVRQHLFPDELGVLMDAYLNMTAEVGPIVSQMSPEEMDAWLRKLGEGASRVPLSLLSSEARTDLLMRSASLLQSFWTANSSVGLQPDGSSMPAEEPPPADLLDAEAPPPVEPDTPN